MRFEVLMMVNIQSMVVIRDVMTCSLAEGCSVQRHSSGLKIKAVHSSETLVPTYQTTHCHMSED